jgi:hypothetical protein
MLGFYKVVNLELKSGLLQPLNKWSYKVFVCSLTTRGAMILSLNRLHINSKIMLVNEIVFYEYVIYVASQNGLIRFIRLDKTKVLSLDYTYSLYI